MDPQIIKSLLPIFAAGFAVQRLVEILDPVVASFTGEDKKRPFLAMLSLIAGIGVAWPSKLQVLTYLGISMEGKLALDYLVAGLMVSAGTEGFNSIIKFLAYKKEETKTSAVAKKLGVSKFLPPKTTLEEAIARGVAGEEVDFTPGEAMLIAYRSVTTTTGSGEPITPTATLAKYGARDPDIPTIRNKVINNTDFGLPHYGRTMDANALKDLATSWTLQDLADVTFEESVEVEQEHA